MTDGAVSVEESSYRVGDRSIPAKLWRPPLEGTLPGIVFVTEAFGLDGEMERLAAMVASWGYVVLAPDLYADGPWVMCVRRLMADVAAGEGRGVDALLAARTELAAHGAVDPEALGILGFCIGGSFALLLARARLFRVSAAFYGQTPSDLSALCPVVASYGGRDRVMTPGAEPLRAALVAQGVPHDIHVYEGAGHGFMNEGAGGPALRLLAGLTPLRSGFDPVAAADAAERTRLFLAEHLSRRPEHGP